MSVTDTSSENDPFYIILPNVETAVYYSLETAAGLVHLQPEVLRYYCRLGLLGEDRAKEDANLIFDDEALYALRSIEQYRKDHGLNRSALPLVWSLVKQIEELKAEIRFLRDRQS